MKPDPKEKHKQHTFDAYCKRILKNESSDYQRRMSVLREHEIPFSMLPKETLAQFVMWDEYFKDTYHFEARGFEISVADELLAEALKTLPQDRLEIVLLYYFLGMSDTEIAAHLNLVRRTVAYRRTSSLQELKKFMEVNADE
ncbi:MAG: sigma-70 family RNA polymerase sigma factor [Lachnospiraceae bacterium]|nr:sigma-70 family RNA polymerase sigma factor [Lachnospiraceae bacterium]